MSELKRYWGAIYEGICKAGGTEVILAADYDRVVAELREKLAAAERDAARLDWFESRHTLHTSIECLYVVDGYELEIFHDFRPPQKPIWGVSLRAAIDAAIAKEKP